MAGRPEAEPTEPTVELTARGRRALAGLAGRKAKPSGRGRRPAPRALRRPAIVGDSTEGTTSLICGIDTLPLETPGMGGIYCCTYCGQTFHEVCIREYRRYSSKCPNPLCSSREMGVPFEVKELR